MGYPPPPWSSGIIDLGENREIIYGAQWFTGKILSRKELGAYGRLPCTPLSPWLASTNWIVNRKDENHTGV